MDQKLRNYIQKKFEECFSEDFQPSEEVERLVLHYKRIYRKPVPAWVRRIKR